MAAQYRIIEGREFGCKPWFFVQKSFSWLPIWFCVEQNTYYDLDQAKAHIVFLQTQPTRIIHPSP